MTATVTNDDLIARAIAVIRSKQVGAYQIGDVGCALLTDTGAIHLGVCIDTGSSLGFCAEHSAIAAMITSGEYRIVKIVAAWRDQERAYILAPCGRCREFIRQIHPDNLQTEVILARDKVIALAELLPYHDWFEPLEARYSG